MHMLGPTAWDGILELLIRFLGIAMGRRQDGHAKLKRRGAAAVLTF